MAFQTMQFFYTGFGKPKEFFGGRELEPIAGYRQGNGGDPPSFSVLSTFIINAYKCTGNGAKLTFCYAVHMLLLAVATYMDDTGLLYWDTSSLMEDTKLTKQVQSSTNDFSSLVEASGGHLNLLRALCIS